MLEGDGDDQGEEDGGEGGAQVSRRTGSGQNAQWKDVRDSILASIPHHTAQYLDYLDPSMHESFIGIIPICYSVVIPELEFCRTLPYQRRSGSVARYAGVHQIRFGKHYAAAETRVVGKVEEQS